MDSEKKIREATELLMQAQSYENSAGTFMKRMFGGAGTALEDASKTYSRAGNHFKSAKQWEQAGKSFKKAAAIYQSSSVNMRHDAATALVDAGAVLKKVNFEGSLECYKEAIDILTDMGRFTMAAKHHVTCAEIHKECENHETAVDHYQQAASYFNDENSKTTADKHDIAAADLLAHHGHRYKEAYRIYERIGNRCADQSLLKYSAKDHYFKALLCHLNLDVVNAQQSLEKYSKYLPSFQDSREYKLCYKLVKATEENNIDDFTSALTEFDQISRLNDFQTSLLLRAKKKLGDGEESGEDGGLC